MLRTEQRNQLYSRRMRQKFDRRSALKVLAGVIGDQPDMLAAQRRKFLRLQYIQSGLHAACIASPAAFFFCAARGLEPATNRSHAA